MASSLSPGPETFTLDRLHAVWREGQQLASWKRSKLEYVQYDANNELKYMRSFCLKLQASVQDPLLHRERIDAAFAPFLTANFGNSRSISADKVCALFGILLYHMLYPTKCMLQACSLRTECTAPIYQVRYLVSLHVEGPFAVIKSRHRIHDDC